MGSVVVEEKEVSGSVYNSTHSLERKSSWMGRSSVDEEDMVVIGTGCVAAYR